MKIKLCFLLFYFGFNLCYSQNIIDYVDPLTGTESSRWMLFPGVSAPFGMVKISPNNQKSGWKSGYDYNINQIMGFSHIHSWATAGLLVMPTNGDLKFHPGTETNPDLGYASRIDKKKEIAKLGYYKAYLEDYKIHAELTATTRTSFMQFKFDEAQDPKILIDFYIPAEYPYELQGAFVKKINDYEIEGFTKQRTADSFTSVFEGIATLDNEYVIYFVMRFDKPIKSLNGWTSAMTDGEYMGALANYTDTIYNISELHILKKDGGAFIELSLKKGEKIKVQTGISFVDMSQARLNLDTETKPFGWNFDKAVLMLQKQWTKLLGLIKIEDTNLLNKKKFYTNLYRSYSARTIFSDVNNKFTDQCEKIQQAKHTVLGCDGFWMTFWNLNPLWSLVTPEVTNMWVNSLLTLYTTGGWLPKGPAALEYSSIMVASHEVPLITSAFQKGIRNYDVQKAYKAVKEVQDILGTMHPCGGFVGNKQLDLYKKLGYVPHGPSTNKFYFGDLRSGPVSNTLEYAFDDWNVAQMAKALGKKEDYIEFSRRANFFKNIYHPDTKTVTPRLKDGSWHKGESTFGNVVRSDSWVGTGFVEANAWQYNWFVPHNVKWLIDFIGRDTFISRLNEGFEESAKVNFNAANDNFALYPVNHGNQPNMQASYLFNYANRPDLTQKWSRAIMDSYYGLSPEDGWPGDEDQGQMGAWFVMSALGLFEMDGGGSTKPIYELGSPLFKKATIHLDPKYYSGKDFVISTENNSKKNIYIQKVFFNDKPLKQPFIYHKDLVKGGSLKFIMGDKPNNDWWDNYTIPSNSTNSN